MCVNGKWSLVGSTTPPKIATVAGDNQPSSNAGAAGAAVG
jgi:hypothetical protein